MTNDIHVGRCGLPAALVTAFLLNGLSFVIFKDGATKGVNYSYVQPDGMTFSIWGLIYTMQVIFVVVQCTEFNVPGLPAARSYMALNYLLSSSWLLVNGAATQGFSFWLAVIVLCLNLAVLAKAYSVLDIDYTSSHHSIITKLGLFLPVSLNLSWVFLAAIVNLSNTLYDPRVTSTVGIGGADWAIAIVGLATAIAGWLSLRRMDLGYGFVAVWAFLGIHRNQQEDGDGPWKGSPELDQMSVICCVVVVVAMIIGVALFICSPKPKKQKNHDGFQRLV